MPGSAALYRAADPGLFVLAASVWGRRVALSSGAVGPLLADEVARGRTPLLSHWVASPRSSNMSSELPFDEREKDNVCLSVWRRVMAEKTWLYIYEGAPRGDEEERRQIYIGIGKSMGRVFEPHNPDAERLRDTEGTLIRYTVEPFSSREDALKAEAIAIHVASLMGLDPIYDSQDEKDDKSVTNIQGRKTSKHLGPAIFTRPGEVTQGEMRETIIVPISPKPIEERASAFGGNPGEVFIDRAAQAWNIASAKRPKIKRLVAVLKKGHVILGSWEVDPSCEWKLVCPEKRPPYRSRVRIPVPHPEQDDVGGFKGKRYVGSLNSGVVYSPDIA